MLIAPFGLNSTRGATTLTPAVSGRTKNKVFKTQKPEKVNVMSSKSHLKFISLILCLSLAGCVDGPSVNSNSSINGNLVGKWRLKTDEFDALANSIHRLTIFEDGRYSRIDSSCLIRQNPTGDQCSITNQWSGKYERAGDQVVFFWIPESTDIFLEDAIISDTMKFLLRRLDEDALIMAYKYKTPTGVDSMYSRYFRDK